MNPRQEQDWALVRAAWGGGAGRKREGEELQDSWVGNCYLHMLPASGYLGLTVEPRRERPRGLRRPLVERAEVRIVEQHAAFLPPRLWVDGSF